MNAWKLLFVIVGFAIYSPTHAANFNIGYVAKVGDFNNDGRQDVYVEPAQPTAIVPMDGILIPVAIGLREVAPFVLQQDAQGKFSIVDGLSAAAVAAIRKWVVQNAIDIIIVDLNADSCLDILLSNIDAVIPGAKDVLVFGPDSLESPPSVVYALDVSAERFFNDLSGFVADPEHYYDDAFIFIEHFIGLVRINVYYCSGPVPGGEFAAGTIDDLRTRMNPHCYLSGFYDDYRPYDRYGLNTALYSQNALDINRSLYDYLTSTGSFTVSGTSAASALSAMSEEFGIEFAPGWSPVDLSVPTTEATPAGSVLGRLGASITAAFRLGELIRRVLHEDYMYHYTWSKPQIMAGLLLGLREGSWITPDKYTSGLVAQQRLALPPKDAADSPPNIWYAVSTDAAYICDPEIPRDWPNEYTTPPTLVHRTGLGIGCYLFQPTEIGSLEGPFPLSD